jgi:cytochrome P450
MRDLLGPGFDADPHPAYREWRGQEAVQYFPRNDVVVVLSYDLAVSVLKDTERFSSSPFGSFSSRLLHAADPPDHTKMRRALTPFFSTARQLEQRVLVKRIADDAAASLSKRESFDVLSDFADRVPLAVASEWLGVEIQTARRLLTLPLDAATWKELAPSLRDDGLIREIESDGGLMPEELAQLTSFFLTASVLTSRDFIWLALYAFAINPAALELARSNPDTIEHVTDELLRLEPPVHAVLRAARANVDLENCSIRSGQVVWVSLAAANRDPSRFENPDEIIIGRAGPRHLSFGSGPHFCLGSHLGKIEAEASLRALLPLLSQSSFGAVPALTFGEDGGLPLMRRVSTWNVTVAS